MQMSLLEAIEIFLKDTTKASGTIKQYRACLSYFYEFIGEKDIEDVKVKNVSQFEHWLRTVKTNGKGQNISALRTYHCLIALKALFRFFYRRYELNCLDPAKIELNKPECGSFDAIMTSHACSHSSQI